MSALARGGPAGSPAAAAVGARADRLAIVWARLKGFPAWPAQALPSTGPASAAAAASAGPRPRGGAASVPVAFFGTGDRGWVAPGDVTPWAEGCAAGFPTRAASRAAFVGAVRQAADLLAPGGSPPPGWWWDGKAEVGGGGGGGVPPSPKAAAAAPVPPPSSRKRPASGAAAAPAPAPAAVPMNRERSAAAPAAALSPPPQADAAAVAAPASLPTAPAPAPRKRDRSKEAARRRERRREQARLAALVAGRPLPPHLLAVAVAKEGADAAGGVVGGAAAVAAPPAAPPSAPPPPPPAKRPRPQYEAIRRNIWLARPRPKRMAKDDIPVCGCLPVPGVEAEAVPPHRQPSAPVVTATAAVPTAAAAAAAAAAVAVPAGEGVAGAADAPAPVPHPPAVPAALAAATAEAAAAVDGEGGSGSGGGGGGPPPPEPSPTATAPVPTRPRSTRRAAGDGSPGSPSHLRPRAPPSHGCGDACLNAHSRIRCDPKSCPAGRACANTEFQACPKQPIAVFLTAHCGWGVKATGPIPAGAFIVEYQGEVVSSSECAARMAAARAAGEPDVYMMDLGPGLAIDARARGSVARLINSSCAPNCVAQLWHDAGTGEPRVGIFAGERPIQPGEELAYDYAFDPASSSTSNSGGPPADYHCKCGAPACRGTIDRAVGPPERAVGAGGGGGGAGTHSAAADAGRRLAVRWDDDGGLYPGTVTAYDARTRTHAVLYDDGATESLRLGEVEHVWLDGGGAGGGAAPAAPRRARTTGGGGRPRPRAPRPPSTAAPSLLAPGTTGKRGRPAGGADAAPAAEGGEAPARRPRAPGIGLPAAAPPPVKLEGLAALASCLDGRPAPGGPPAPAPPSASPPAPPPPPKHKMWLQRLAAEEAAAKKATEEGEVVVGAAAAAAPVPATASAPPAPAEQPVLAEGPPAVAGPGVTAALVGGGVPRTE
jgi:hypothetical protein